MRQLPIPFAAPMVLALKREMAAAGTGKSETRRVLSPIPTEAEVAGFQLVGCDTATGRSVWEAHGADGRPVNAFPVGNHSVTPIVYVSHVPGTCLWVREAWRVPAALEHMSGSQIGEAALDAGYKRPWCPIQYEADAERNSETDWAAFGSNTETVDPGRLRAARFMPRWASRITLIVSDVRIERLQDISSAGTIAEGAECDTCMATGRSACNRAGCFASRRAFRQLWDELNAGKGKRDFPWSSNPWVRVTRFRVVGQNVDEVLA